VQQGPSAVVEVDGIPHRITREQRGLVRAPSSALVVAVAVKNGDRVCEGDRLLVVEAMKTETSVLAPLAGRVREVFVRPNVQVGPGVPLLFIEAAAEEAPSPGAERIDLAALADGPDLADTPEEVLAGMRGILLGYDLEPAQLQPLMERWRALAAERKGALVEEARLLAIFVDSCALFRRQPAHDDEDARRSAGEYLFAYLRDVSAGGAALPEAFVERLRRALRHYGVSDLARTADLDEALFRICTAHEREESHAAAAFRLLERWLEAPPAALAELGPRLGSLLERTVAETRQRHPALHDLAREVRYRHFERPLLEEARRCVFAEAETHLAALREAPAGPERDRRIAALVECPQPLTALLSGRFQGADSSLRQAILEVLTRRYYRIRELGPLVTECDADGRCVARVAYRHQGRTIHLIATHANAQRLSEAARLAGRLTGGVPEGDDVALDFYLWQRGGLCDADATAQGLAAVLDAASFSRPVRRVVAAVAGPDMERPAGGVQYFTFRQRPAGFVEDRLHRGIHPMMAKRLHLERLSEFDLERLPSPEDVYVLLGRARGNPRDERLFVMAEVRDLTAVRGPEGEVVQLPHLERVLMEALAGMRRVQARRPPGRRLHGNRVLLYVWPPFEFGTDEVQRFVRRLAPVTEGLCLEAVALHVRRPGESGLVDSVIEVSNPAGQGTVVTFAAPSAAPVAPLSEYEQKVVRLAQRGLTYPYEIVRMLTPPPGAHTEFPPGEFTEYDLEGGRLRPVIRPFGRNVANVVVGLIRNFTPGHPQGIARVLVLGDPSRDLGALAEPECARIVAALDLAARRRLPVDWIALSAGARISMESGTENMDWIARVLRRLVGFTQAGGEVNVVVNGINVGAQPYWNAEATMLMHTRGVLVMLPDSAMVLTGKRALEYSGGVSAEDNQGIGGYERIMGPNGQAQYFARDLGEACHLLLRHHELTFVVPGERFPRRRPTSDPAQRNVCAHPYARADGQGFRTVGDVFSEDANPGRKKPFDIRCVMAAVADQDDAPLERWASWQDAETAVVWDVRLGGRPVCLVGIESRPLRRLGFVPADGPDRWTGGTLFPQSSRKLARALNAASGNRPAVVLANLTGFDGSPESLRLWQLEYGAEIGRAVVNFDGPLIFCVINRYHGGAFVVFSNALNDDLQVMALEGTYASVIGGAPAAAVVFAREVDRRVAEDPRVQALEAVAAAASPAEAVRLQGRLEQLTRVVHAEVLGRVAEEFDAIHTVQRAQRVGSVHAIVDPCELRARLIAAVERGIAAVNARARRPAAAPAASAPLAAGVHD
jgi:acetyl-CoA carboxylase carboxyltransferase component